jgi:peptide-methionine (R)-S-oxide reductase
MKTKPLTPEEKRIIEGKATEPPFTGKYNNFFPKSGLFVCRKCARPLFSAQTKFEAGCGWPSFDQSIEGAIKRVLDTDGRRTEIICENCGAHLGHVFEGEDLTDKNTRHCVNSLSIQYLKKSK